jgi:hypothetical protein
MFIPINNPNNMRTIVEVTKSQDGTLRVYGDSNIVDDKKLTRFVKSLLPISCVISEVKTGHWQKGTAHAGSGAGLVLMITFVDPADRKLAIRALQQVSNQQSAGR